jgi:hypothetical protein
MKTVRIALLASVCLAGQAIAQEMRLDLSKLPPEVAAQVIKAEQERKAGSGSVPLPTTVEQAEQYAKIGEQVSRAVATTAKGLSIEVNEFVKTPVGWWVSVFMLWYFLGAKLWHIVGGILFWIASTTMLWKSAKQFLMERRVLVSDNGKEKTYTYKTYEFRSNEAKGFVGFAHILMFAIVSIATIILVL